MINGLVTITWLVVNLANTNANRDGYFIAVPRNRTFVINSTAELPCRINDDAVDAEGFVTWFYKNLEIRHLKQDGERVLDARRILSGDPSKYEFNLRISNVTVADEGAYRCSLVIPGSDYFEHKAFLSILVPPGSPKLTNQDPKISGRVDDDPIDVHCETEGARPAAEIRWVVSRDPAGKDVVRELQGVSQTHPHPADRRLTDTHSRVRYDPQKVDNGHHLVCVLHHESLRTPFGDRNLYTAAQLAIKYPPKLAIERRPQEIKAGSRLELRCNVLDANPRVPTGKVYWTNEAGEQVGKGPVHTLTVSQSHHKKRFACVAENHAGRTRESISLNVTYGPRLNIYGQKTKIGWETGSPYTFSCAVDSNPPTVIHWHKAGTSDILHTGSNYTIEASKATAGEYYCEAIVKGFAPARQRFSLNINGPPEVYTRSRQAVTEGETVVVPCKMTSYPRGSAPTWYRRAACDVDDIWTPLEAILNSNEKGRYTFGKFVKEDHQVAELTIRNFLIGDLGCYNCSVTNSYGFDSSTIELTKIDALPWYFLIPVIVVVTALLLALAVCACCMNKRSLCKSTKSSHPDLDDDVNVKVEAADGRPYYEQYKPADLYAAEPGLDPPAYNGQEYILVPGSDDHQGIDNLPPPFPGYSPQLFSAQSNHSHVTYLTDDSSPLVNGNGCDYVVVAGAAGTYPHSFSEYGLPSSLHASPYVARVTSEYTNGRFEPLYTNGAVGGGTLPRSNIYTPIKSHSHSPILVGPSRTSPHGYDATMAPVSTSIAHVPVTAVAAGYPVVTTSTLTTLEPVREMPTPEEQLAADPRATSQQSTHV